MNGVFCMEVNLLDPNSVEYHNIVIGETGLEVRKGLVSKLDVQDVGKLTPRSSDGSQMEFMFGFSCESANTGVVYHYLFSIDDNRILYQSIYDDQFNLLAYSSVAKIASDSEEPFSYAINYNQIIVNSRSLPYPLWGFVGDTLIRAEKIESINPDTPALTLFPGRVCSFADRFVWAYANQIIVNDPGTEPRTICAPNAISFGGTVLDLFQSGEGGNLVVVCTDATYQIPPDSLAGYQLQGFVSKTPGYQGVQSNNAASARGAIVGLVKDGIIQLGTFAKQKLTTYKKTRKLARPVGPYGSGDYRRGNILATEEGFVVSINKKFCFIDLDTGISTWYYADVFDDLTVVGILKDQEGKDFFVTKYKVLELTGNKDVINTPTVAQPEPTEVDVRGYLLVNVPSSPEMSPVVREITVSCDRPTTQITTYLRNSSQTATVPTVPYAQNIIGTSLWDANTTFSEREQRSRRMQRAVRIDSPDFEICFDKHCKIAPVANVVTKGIGRNRPSN